MPTFTFAQGTDQDALLALESATGYKLPDDLKQFFLEYSNSWSEIGTEWAFWVKQVSGSISQPYILKVYSPEELHDSWFWRKALTLCQQCDEWPKGVLEIEHVFPFARLSSGQLYMAVAGRFAGRIYAIDVDRSQVDVVANSLAAFKALVHAREIDVVNPKVSSEDSAYLALEEYIDKLAKDGGDEFAPFEHLGQALFQRIQVLPPSVGRLKQVRKMWLYGSQLHQLPPEIGDMEALEYFDAYTSYHLHWLPFEIIQCKQLKDSRLSTRALFGNYKTRLAFPSLKGNPARYSGSLSCSVCRASLTYETTKQLWISMDVATDTMPLLVNVCSPACEAALPQPADGYIDHPHQGGCETPQPTEDGMDMLVRTGRMTLYTIEEREQQAAPLNRRTEPRLLRLLRKVWT